MNEFIKIYLLCGGILAYALVHHKAFAEKVETYGHGIATIVLLIVFWPYITLYLIFCGVRGALR